MSNASDYSPRHDIVISLRPAGAIVYGIDPAAATFETLGDAEHAIIEWAREEQHLPEIWINDHEQPGLESHEIDEPFTGCTVCGSDRPGSHAACARAVEMGVD